MNYLLKQNATQATATMIWSSFKIIGLLFSLHSIIFIRLRTLPHKYFSSCTIKLQTVEIFKENLFFNLFSLCTGNINFSRDPSSVLDWYKYIYFPCLSILGLRPHSLSSLSKKLWILFILLNSLSVNYISINWAHFRLLYVHTCLSLHQ